jgi:preprotein translocase subunit SecE
VANVTRSEKGPAGGPAAGVVEYIEDTRAEMRKVVWPTREEAMNLTVVVLFVTIIMTIILGGIDFVFAQLLEFVLSFGA